VAARGWERVIRGGGWRLRVSHETRFDYDAPARASYNEVRLTPRTELRQTALETRIITLPSAQQYAYVDYWGSHVVAFNVDRGHEVLTVTGSSLVDTHSAEEPDDCDWSEVGDASLTMADYVSHRLYTAPGPELVEVAAGLGGGRPLETARRIFAWTHDALQYQRGVTSVHTSANEAYADCAGVCQDFAHLSLALTRTAGIPSRYVSGYFHPEPDATIGEEITGESHAWVEVWTGKWWGYDPTNDLEVGERHVAVGRGRDYSDVPPVKGIYAGNAENTMRVAVRMTRTT
jgi:transglutaminase-like putative cysteine protease